MLLPFLTAWLFWSFVVLLLSETTLLFVTARVALSLTPELAVDLRPLSDDLRVSPSRALLVEPLDARTPEAEVLLPLSLPRSTFVPVDLLCPYR